MSLRFRSLRFRFKSFRPKLFDTLAEYPRSQFVADASAGLTVGVLAIPLAMAFAIASGASPAAGLWTAIIAGFCISAFGGSRVQIGGPTGAFIPILYAIAARYGMADTLAATFMAGLLLFAMGLAGLGNLIRLIPVAVVIGFTNGIAIVIAFSQVRDFLGLPIDHLPAEFFSRLRILAASIGDADGVTAVLGGATFLLILSWGRAAQRWPRLAVVPAQMAGLVVGTLACVLLSLQVETLGSRFGGIPQGVPDLHLPLPALERIGSLLSPAIAIALLGAIESLLSARVADTQIHDRHDPNQELLAQGIANMASPVFGGIAANGAIARTATNVRAGGRTPVAGIVHAAVLLLVVLLAAPLAAYVPICVLAAVVLVTALRMGEWHEFSRLRHFSWNYRVVLLSTFALTVLFDLTIAVEIGMVLACLFFIYRMQDLTSVERVADAALPAGARLYALHGSLFFGSVIKLEMQLGDSQLGGAALRVVVLDLHEVINIDTSGVDWLQGLQRSLTRQGTVLVLCGLGRQPASIVQRSGLAVIIGPENVVADREAAIRRMKEITLEVTHAVPRHAEQQ